MEYTLSETATYLLRQSWQIAVVFAVVAVACVLLRRRSAHWRYLLWLVVLVKCLVPPLVTVPLAVLPQSTPQLAGLPGATAMEPSAGAEVSAPPAAPAGSVSAAGVFAAPAMGLTVPSDRGVLAPLTPAQWFAGVWIGGAGLFGLFMVAKAWRVHRRLSRARAAAPDELRDDAARLAERLGLRAAPRLWVVADYAQPFVWGLLRGSIYVPARFAETGSADDRRVILAHELAHISRWDATVNAIQVLAQAMFFFHPLIWWANRKIRQEREKCCDEMAIAALSAEPRRYGGAIVDVLISEYQSAAAVPSLAVAGPVKNIEERIRTIMRPNKRFYARPTWMVIVTVAALTAISVPTGVLLTARAVAENGPPDSQAGPTNPLSLQAEAFVDLLAAGKFDKAREKFGKQMKRAMSSGDLDELWKKLGSVGGEYLGRSSVTKVEAIGEYQAMYVPCAWQRNRLDLKVVFNAAGQISGLWTMPPSEAAERASGAEDTTTETYIVTFKPVSPFAPQMAGQLLAAFNRNHPQGVRTHDFRTEGKGDTLVGYICVDAKAGKAAVVKMIAESEKLELLRARLAGQKDLKELYAMGQPGLASQQDAIPAGAVSVSYVDDTAEGKRSIGASGHAVLMQRPAKARFVEAVEIFASRYGRPQAPKEDFHLYILNDKRQVLADLRYPYGMIERADMRWYTFRTPSIEVPRRFYVLLAFNPHRTKGIYLGVDENVKTTHSYQGLPETRLVKLKGKQDWMVRAQLCQQPSGAKGTQRLADWKPPEIADPFVESFEVKLDTGRSQGKQSYSGSGPAVRVELADLLGGKIKLETAELVGIRIYASRYGSGYVPEKTPMTVSLIDSKGKVQRRQSFPYSLLGYKEKWVTLELGKPLPVKQLPDDKATLSVAFDPKAHRTKGIYFHYNKDPKVSHSSVGTIGRGGKPLSDREWMVRLYFRSGGG